MKALEDCSVLLVDDTITNVDLLVQALKDLYRLGVALNGKDAVKYAVEKQPDLILLDIVMPEMDGFEVCSRLRSSPATADIPIIFITAIDDLGHKAKGFEFGAVDYITKPFDTAEVRARVKTHLTLKLALEALRNQNAILEEKVMERTLELRKTQIEIIDRLGMAAEFRDKETGAHINRMSQYCRIMGREMGLSKERYDLLGLASTMHDVGKIGIADNILLKPGRLTHHEKSSMMTHTAIGEKLLSGSSSPLLNEAKVIAKTHHEKWDGSGYDQGLRGEAIPIFGRIACLCDVFDALISERPYKNAWPLDRALEEIKNGSGKFFDPLLVEIFLKIEKELRKIIAAYSR